MKEEALQRQVAEFLDRFLPDGALWFHCPNGGHRNRVVAAKLKAQGVKRGVPDVIILWEGRAHFIELKAPRGRLTPEQRAFRDNVHAQGCPWFVCWSFQEVADICEAWFPMKARLAA